MITSTNARNSYLGTGTLATYAFTFKVFKAQDLEVIRINADGIATTLVLNTNYTVAGLKKQTGGSITLTGGNLATGHKLIIRLKPELKQETNFDNGGRFYPETHEMAFDKQTQVSLFLKDEVDRSIKLHPSIDPVDFDPTLPAIIGPYKILMVNEYGTGLAAGPTPQELSDAAEAAISTGEDAAAAAASKNAAAASAEAAADSAAASAASANESLNHANDSQGSASNAAASASAAAGSASNASSFATQAASYIIRYGTGAPAPGLGEDNNAYIDQATGSFYRKESGTWNLKVTLTGSGGVSSFNGRSAGVMPQAGDYDKTMVGLANVDNTSDANKPVSTATQTALNLKANDADLETAELAIVDLQADVADLQDQIDNLDPGSASPLTTKGDLYTFGTANDRLAVGANGKVLTAKSSAPLGISWEDAPISLPAITPVTDEGKYLAVVSGVAAWVTPPSNNPTVFGTFGSPRSILATGLTSALGHMSTTALNQVIFVRGNTADAEMDITANPQIQAHTIVGALATVFGTDSTRPVLFEDGNGLKLNGPASLNANQNLELLWDGTAWVELARRV